MTSLLIQGITEVIAAILGTTYLLPKIISIIRFKRLMDNPNERSSHTKATPSLGGMAFYIILVISFYFNAPHDYLGISTCLYPPLIIIFFLGLKDDLVILSPVTKLMGQLIACGFIVTNPNFHITHLYGFLGIGEIPVWMGVTIATLLMLLIINSFNLIDGIDGLAALTAMVAFSGFAVVFFLAAKPFMGLTCLVMVGILIGFLFFNLSTRNKIFMGDTGSMMIGLMLGMMSVRFLSLDMDSLHKLPFNPMDIPIIITAFLIVPLFDTPRVMAIRLLRGKGLFTADRNHLHHVIVDAYNIPHAKASLALAIFNIIWVGIISLIIKLTTVYVCLTVIVILLTLASIYLYLLKRSIFSNVPERNNAQK